MDYLLCGNLPYPAWKKRVSVQNLSNRRIRRYLVCRLKRPEARDFSHVRFTKGYTPEEAEKIASICRSYYKSIDKMQAELSEKSMKIHEIFNEQSVKKGSWQQKYLTDFDKYVSKCRYCLNSGLDLPDEPLFTDYVPDLIPVEEELNQESAAAGMTLEEYIKKEYLFK